MIIKIGEPPKKWHEICLKGKENILNINNDKNPIVKQEDTFGIGDDFMISKLKIGKTNFIVSSYFYKGTTFPDVMEQVIKHKITAS